MTIVVPAALLSLRCLTPAPEQIRAGRRGDTAAADSLTPTATLFGKFLYSMLVLGEEWGAFEMGASQRGLF
jgi:hypothetical protein